MQFAQLVQYTTGMVLCGSINCIDYVFRQNGFLILKNRRDMIIFNFHVVQCADLSDDIIVHGNDTNFETSAKLKVWLAVTKQKDIGCVSSDINNKHSRSVDEHSALRHHGGIGLRVHKAVVDLRLARHSEVNAKIAPDEASVKAARKALKANTLSWELTDLLIEKILVYPGNHLAICWKLAAFEIDFEYTEEYDYAG